MKWNDRLLKAREDAGRSDTDIARVCKVSNPTVHGWMTGKTVNIEAHNLLAACKLLNVSPFYIMFGEEVPGLDLLTQNLKVDAMDILRLIGWFAQATEDGRNYILDAAMSAAKQ